RENSGNPNFWMIARSAATAPESLGTRELSDDASVSFSEGRKLVASTAAAIQSSRNRNRKWTTTHARPRASRPGRSGGRVGSAAAVRGARSWGRGAIGGGAGGPFDAASPASPSVPAPEGRRRITPCPY